MWICKSQMRHAVPHPRPAFDHATSSPSDRHQGRPAIPDTAISERQVIACVRDHSQDAPEPGDATRRETPAPRLTALISPRSWPSHRPHRESVWPTAPLRSSLLQTPRGLVGPGRGQLHVPKLHTPQMNKTPVQPPKIGDQTGVR